MQGNALLIAIECLISNTWNLLTNLEYPGLGVSFAAILCGCFLIVLSIKLLKRILGGFS